MKQLRMTAVLGLILASAMSFGLSANAQSKGKGTGSGAGSGSAPKKIHKGMQACLKDKSKFCAKTKGRKETMACLKDNEAKLSDACKVRLAEKEKSEKGGK